MLDGYRALDLTDEKGFMCGKILGDLGVDVIKIEKPGGDPSRNIPPYVNNVPNPEQSLYWIAFNINKRGITLDIAKDEGKEIFKQLVKTADFIIESYTPGYLHKLGLGYPILSKMKPTIILTSITPYGQSGPYKAYKGSDITLMAMGSLMAMTGDPDRPPLRMALDQSYALASLYAATGTIIAHYFREISGEGQQVDISIQESVIDANYWDLVRYDFVGSVTKRAGSRHPRARGATSMVWPCKDGYVTWFTLGGPQGAEEISFLRQWMADEGSSIGPLEKVDWHSIHMSQLSKEDLKSIEQCIGMFFRSHTAKELVEGSAKKKIRLTKINNFDDVLRDEQLKSRDYWTKLDYPFIPIPVSYPDHFFLSDKVKCGFHRRAPLIGEHNQEVYQKELGYSEEQINKLIKLNVI